MTDPLDAWRDRERVLDAERDRHKPRASKKAASTNTGIIEGPRGPLVINLPPKTRLGPRVKQTLEAIATDERRGVTMRPLAHVLNLKGQELDYIESYVHSTMRVIQFNLHLLTAEHRNGNLWISFRAREASGRLRCEECGRGWNE